MIYCDTSTLAKYYVPELETPCVQARLDAEDQHTDFSVEARCQYEQTQTALRSRTRLIERV